MKFLIFGAGAVGRALGARLHQAGHETVLITRPAAADLLADKGLTYTNTSGEQFTVQPTLVSSLRQGLALAEETGQPYDYLCLTMKAYDLPTAINELLAYCPQNPPTLLPFQNGIGAEEKLSEHYPEELILSGSFNLSVNVDVNGSIHEEQEGGLAISSMVPNRIPKDITAAFRSAGFNTQPVKDYQSMKWSKLILTVMGNATAAIVNRPPQALYKYKPIYELEKRMIKEIQEVMKAMNLAVLDLPGASAKKLLTALRWVPSRLLQSQLAKQVSRGRGDRLPSFQVDLNAGKGQNEVIYHNGAVHQIGRELNVSTPINGALTHILLQLVHEEVNWEIYDGKPKELVQAVNEYIRNQRETA